MNTRIRMAAAGLFVSLLLVLVSGCNESVKSVSNPALTAQDYSLYSSQSVVPQPSYSTPATSAPTSSANAGLASDIPSVRKMLLQALQSTNAQTNFCRNVTRSLQLGEVELTNISESLQSAKTEAGLVQLGHLEASYKPLPPSPGAWRLATPIWKTVFSTPSPPWRTRPTRPTIGIRP